MCPDLKRLCLHTWQRPGRCLSGWRWWRRSWWRCCTGRWSGWTRQCSASGRPGGKESGTWQNNKKYINATQQLATKCVNYHNWSDWFVLVKMLTNWGENGHFLGDRLSFLKDSVLCVKSCNKVWHGSDPTPRLAIWQCQDEVRNLSGRTQNLKVAKRCWKQLNEHNLIYIYHKQCENMQKIQWKSWNGQIQCF